MGQCHTVKGYGALTKLHINSHQPSLLSLSTVIHSALRMCGRSDQQAIATQLNETNSGFRLHRMHEMQTIVTDDRGVCQSVC